jgi:gliding motility-associated-like protein
MKTKYKYMKKHNKFTFFFLMVMTSVLIQHTSFASNALISGSLDGENYWNTDTVFITGSVTIEEEATLMIHPGTFIEFSGHYPLLVKGRIIANGNPDSLIVFTSVGNSWDGIWFDGIASETDSSFLTHCIIENAKSSGDGGAIYINGFSKLKLEYSKIQNNVSESTGGGIYINNAKPYIRNCMILNNKASGEGGGMYVNSSQKFNITNNIIANNEAASGGAVYLNSSPNSKIYCNTICNNKATTGDGSGIYSNSSNPHVINSIVWGNDMAGNISQVSYSLIEGGHSGAGNIDQNPEFISPTAFTGTGETALEADWHLTSESPCIDNGDPNITNHNIALQDIDGDNRILNNTIDIGADETIKAIPEFLLVAKTTTICEGMNNYITLKNHPGDVDYQWEKNGEDIQGEQNDTLFLNNIGLSGQGYYSCRITVSPNTSISSDTLYMTVNPLPSPTVVYSPECMNTSVRFSANTAIPVSNVKSFTWIFPFDSSSFGQTTQYAFTQDTNTQVTLIVESQNGCIDSVTEQATTYPLPVVDFEYNAECENIYFYNLSSISGGYIDSVVWNLGAGRYFYKEGFIYERKPEEHISQASLTAISEQGCTNRKDSTIVAPVIPSASFETTNNNYGVNEDIQFTNNSTNAENYHWDFGNNSMSSTETNPIYSYPEQGTYVITLEAISADDCKDTDSKKIIIASHYAVPDAFSPNNDYINDVLYVYGGPFEKLDFRIFNKWGTLVFESDNINSGWDGTFGGKNQPMGIYFYVLEIVTFDGKKHSKKGEVVLVR